MLGKIKESLREKTMDYVDRGYQINYWGAFGRAACFTRD